MMKRLRMYNTSRLYKQNRFNLLHEESEGYAKVKRREGGREGRKRGLIVTALDESCTKSSRSDPHSFSSSSSSSLPP